MKTRYLPLLIIFVVSVSCFKTIERDSRPQKPARLTSLPDNPCELLDAAQVSAITGLEIVSAKRVPSLEKIVHAQTENREPDPGTICNYETRSDFGAILIAVPAGRSAAEYWETRAKYFQTFPGAAQPLADLGADAWFSGGSTLHVLVRGDEYFTLSTQMNQPRSREVLINIAEVVLKKF